jgi:hypothetical protein
LSKEFSESLQWSSFISLKNLKANPKAIGQNTAMADGDELR